MLAGGLVHVMMYVPKAGSVGKFAGRKMGLPLAGKFRIPLPRAIVPKGWGRYRPTGKPSWTPS